MKPQSNRLLALDGLRGWAALGVFVWHTFDLFAPVVVAAHLQLNDDGGALLRLARTLPIGFAFNGTFAVYLFFVLSGFVLTHQMIAGRLFGRAHELVARRWLRLLPVVVVGSAVGFLVLRLGGFGVPQISEVNGMTNDGIYDPTVFEHLDAWSWFKQTFGTVWATPHLNTLYNRVLWTIGIEFQCSVLVYSSVSLFHKVRNRFVVHALTAFAGVCIIGVHYLPFALGVLMAEWMLREPRPSNRSPLLGCLLLLFGCYCGSFHMTAKFDWWLPFMSRLPKSLQFETGIKLVYTLGSGALLYAALTLPPFAAFLGNRLSRFLGYVSYPFYAVHQPLLYWIGSAVFVHCLPTMGYTAAAFAGTAAAFFASVTLAVIVTRWIDAPLNRWGKAAVTKWMASEAVTPSVPVSGELAMTR